MRQRSRYISHHLRERQSATPIARCTPCQLLVILYPLKQVLRQLLQRGFSVTCQYRTLNSVIKHSLYMLPLPLVIEAPEQGLNIFIFEHVTDDLLDTGGISEVQFPGELISTVPIADRYFFETLPRLLKGQHQSWARKRGCHGPGRRRIVPSMWGISPGSPPHPGAYFFSGNPRSKGI